MNCIEFRRKLLEEPRNKEADYLEHAQRCSRCQSEFQKAISLENLIEDALRVPAPERLRHEILLSTRFGQTRRRRYWIMVAGLAASLVIAVGLVTTNSMKMDDGRGSLPEALIAHIKHEPDNLAHALRVPDGQLKILLRDLKAELVDDLGDVRYANLCPIHHRMGLHLVIVGRLGLVSLLFMPGEYIAAGMQFDSQGLHGVIVPNSAGSLAILGQPGERVQEIAVQLNPRVRWRI